MLERLLTRNMSVLDRVVRLVIGTALLSLVVFGPQTLWGLLGLIPLATAVMGICPAYSLLGISSCSSNPKGVAHSC